MLRSVLRLSLLLAIFLLIGTVVSACSCLPPGSPAEERNRSDAVFSGTVEQITDSTTSGFMGPGQDVDVTFHVSQQWKGPVQDKLTVTTEASSAACGYSFREGEDYLVYAQEEYGKENGDLTVSLCSRTSRLEDASEDLNVLGTDEPTRNNSSPGKDNDKRTPIYLYSIAGIAILLGILLAAVAYRRYFYP